MFGRFGSFLTGVIVGGILVFGSQRYHVLRAEDGIHFVPKMTASPGIRTFPGTVLNSRLVVASPSLIPRT